MTLKLEDKKVIVAEVEKIAQQAVSAAVADYRGLTVAELTALRKKARENRVYLRVVRNTLARRALKDTDYTCLNDALLGPVFLAFSMEEPGSAARLLKDFMKTNEKLEVRALSLGAKLLAADQLTAVAELPTRDQALSMLAGVLIAPVTKFVRTLAEPHAKLVRTIAAVQGQKQG